MGETQRGGVVKAALPEQTPVIKYNAFFDKFKPLENLLGLKYKESYPEVRFAIERYSDEAEDELVTILRPFVEKYLNPDDQQYVE